MPIPAERTTIAILGDDTVADNALALLLRGVGYDARIVEASPTGWTAEVLEDVGLVLVSPGLDAGRREQGFALSRKGAGEMPAPILQLSSAWEEALFSDEVAVLPWPSGFEEVARVIESVLTPAAPAGAEGAGASP